MGELASQSFSRAESPTKLDGFHLSVQHPAVQPSGDAACQLFQERRLTPLGRGVPSPGMGHGKKKFSGSPKFSGPREPPKKGPPLGLVIALAAAGGVVIGSAGTYFFSKPLAAPKQSVSPAAVGTPQAQTITMPPQQQFTPAPQPPGEAPLGKVWSVQHGHWHDAPGGLTIPAPATVTPAPATVTPAPATVTPASATVTPKPETTPAPATVTPAEPPPAPAAAPAEKKE
jgi:hypothetical protein